MNDTDPPDVIAARERARSRELRLAQLEVLELRVDHMDASQLAEVIHTFDVGHLDAADGEYDLNFLRGYAKSMIRGARLDEDSERREHVRRSLAAVRDTIRANAEYGARYGAPPGLRSHHDAITDEQRARDAAADAASYAWARKPTHEGDS